MNFNLSELAQEKTDAAKTAVQTSVQEAVMNLIEPMIPYLIAFAIIIAFAAVVWIFSMVQQMRAHNATIAMKKILEEMNEREKNNSRPTA